MMIREPKQRVHESLDSIAKEQRMLNRQSLLLLALLLVDFLLFPIPFSLTSKVGPFESEALKSALTAAFILSICATLYYYFEIVVQLYFMTNQLRLNKAFSLLVILTTAAFPPAFPIIILVANAELYRRWRRLNVESSFFGLSRIAIESLENDPRCLGCGYDLQGNQSGICPECGRSVTRR